MKNKFYFITLIIFITLLTAQIVHAAYDPNRGVAMSVGTDYSGFWPWQADIDTTNEVLKQNKNYEIVSQKDEVIYDINDGKYKILSFTEIKDIETQTFYVLENIR